MNQVLAADTTLNNYINEFSMTEASLNTTTEHSASNATSSVCTITNIPLSDQTQPLVNKIKYLEEELSNAKADKEFVWSLWKQLQSSNPNLTIAIGQAVQREKEKSEIKDRKVLEILKIKDRKLEENEKNIASLTTEIENLQNKIKNYEFESVSKHEEVELLKKNVKTNEDKEQMYEQIIRLRDDKMEKMVKDNEQEKIYLINKVRDLDKEIESIQFECGKKASELEVRNLELKTVSENYEKLLNELNHFKDSIDQSLKCENDSLRSELRQKNEKFEKLRLEFESLETKMKSNLECMNQQDKLIKQLKQIQNDQQNTILSQKNTYDVLESENLSIKKMYDDLLKKFEMFVKQDKSAQLIEKCEKLEAKEKINKDLVKTKNNEIQKLKMELDMFKEKLGYAESIVNELNRKCELLSDSVIRRDEYKKSVVKNNKRSKSQNPRPVAEQADETEDVESSDKIKYYQNLCDIKERELSTLRTAHQRRLDKLMSLEKENELLKQQLDLDEEEESEQISANSKIKAKGYKRIDSQLVSKELTILKQKNQELNKENFRLKESLDEYKYKIDEQSEKIETLKFELNLNLKDQEKSSSKKNEIYEKNLNEKREKCYKLESELANIKELNKDLDAKCVSLSADKDKYLSLSNKLTLENKRLCKKWFELRKKENKFKLLISQQIRKYSNETKNKSHQETIKKPNKATSIQLKSKNLKLQQFKKQTDELIRQRTSLELKSDNLRQYNEKLVKEIEGLEQKLKNSRVQIENLNNEISCLKRKENQLKDSQDETIKKEQGLRDELKKQMEAKNRQLCNDLNRQVAQNKGLKVENEKLFDRLKVNEEKINHLERDINQKKQLVDFYKKKLDENQIKSDPVLSYSSEQLVNDLKSQIKKMSDLVEKYKLETKNLRLSLQTIQASRREIEEKNEKSEKTTSILKERITSLKKQKEDLESRLNEEHKRVLNLEDMVNELESSAQNKLKSLSQASHETLNMAQIKVKYAFNLAENLENLIKNLYENLITRAEKKLKEIRFEKQKDEKIEMKYAKDLASSVLNMSQSDLDELLNEKGYFENKYQKLLFEFEQNLNRSRKENLDDESIISMEKICNLITERIEEIIDLEKKLICLKKC